MLLQTSDPTHPTAWWPIQPIDFRGSDLLCMGAQDEVDLVRRGIDLIEQTLQIKRATGAGGGEDEFHFGLTFHQNRPKL